MADSSDHGTFDILKAIKELEEFKLDSPTNQLVLSNVDMLLNLKDTARINFEDVVSKINLKVNSDQVTDASSPLLFTYIIDQVTTITYKLQAGQISAKIAFVSCIRASRVTNQTRHR